MNIPSPETPSTSYTGNPKLVRFWRVSGHKICGSHKGETPGEVADNLVGEGAELCVM